MQQFCSRMDYVEEIRLGNQAAYEELYHTYHERFYFYLLKNARSETLAEEIVQIAFIKLWENRKKLSRKYPVEVQLARTVRSLMVDALRKKASERRALTFIKENTDMSFDINPVENKQLREQVATAIDSLPTECKKIYSLSRDEGLTYNEIANNLSISPKTVENQISKALKRVKEAVAYY